MPHDIVYWDMGIMNNINAYTSYANYKDLSIQQVEMVSFDKLFGFGI
jgi:hypothetical protein